MSNTLTSKSSGHVSCRVDNPTALVFESRFEGHTVDRSTSWLQPRIGSAVRAALNVNSIIRAVSAVMKCPKQTVQQRAFFEQVSDFSGFTKIMSRC